MDVQRRVPLVASQQLLYQLLLLQRVHEYVLLRHYHQVRLRGVEHCLLHFSATLHLLEGLRTSALADAVDEDGHGLLLGGGLGGHEVVPVVVEVDVVWV